MDYAIIEYKGKQYLLKEKDTISIPGTYGKEGEIISDAKAMLVKDGSVKVGSPYLKESVNLRVVEHTKGPKIRVETFRAKSRYRRTKGHRQEHTILTFEGVGEQKKAQTTASKSAKKTQESASATTKKTSKKEAKKTTKKTTQK